MNKERLEHLITVLQMVPEAKFNLDEWRAQRALLNDKGEPIVGDDQSYSEVEVRAYSVPDFELKHTCGTTGCAIGWACADPIFKKQGLHYQDTGPSYSYAEGYSAVGWAAVTAFFDISQGLAHTLFDPASYDDNARPCDVIQRITDALAL